MEITTIQKYLHTSPRKLRLVSDMVRKMTPNQAVSVLKVTPKMAAKDLEKALTTVLANAKQQGLDVTKLSFGKIEINESLKMRRFRAGTRGRVKPYKKRMSHIKIVLTDDLKLKTQKSNPIKSSIPDKVGIIQNAEVKKAAENKGLKKEKK